MAKKDRRQKESKNPFSALKGFSVSPPAAVPPPRPAPKASTEEPEPEDLFAQEMSRLGVRGAEPKNPAPVQPAKHENAQPLDERTLFLAALGEMDSVLVKEDDEKAPARPPSFSLAQEARLGRIVPEETLDLHGMTRTEALDKVAWLVDNALYNGCRYLLIITGRGRQSGEAVLREAVEGWLNAQAGQGVREWCRAPARLGGDGALLLALRKKE